MDRIPAFVNELVQLKVDIIVAPSNVAIVAAKKATKIIPIVMKSSVDPISAGYVDSLARPGGTVTGLTRFTSEFEWKAARTLKGSFPDDLSYRCSVES